MVSMRLEARELPESRRRKPMYAAYVPVVEEFLAGGAPSAALVLDEGDDEPDVAARRLRGAIAATCPGEARVVVREGDPYLVSGQAR